MGINKTPLPTCGFCFPARETVKRLLLSTISRVVLDTTCRIISIRKGVTTIVTGHGNIRSYLHRLKIIGIPECPYSHDIQTLDHLIFQCKRIRNKRAILKSNVLKEGKWPVSKCELTNRNLKQFINYINSVDFEKINQSDE
jgi:hypothetical protein